MIVLHGRPLHQMIFNFSKTFYGWSIWNKLSLQHILYKIRIRYSVIRKWSTMYHFMKWSLEFAEISVIDYLFFSFSLLQRDYTGGHSLSLPSGIIVNQSLNCKASLSLSSPSISHLHSTLQISLIRALQNSLLNLQPLFSIKSLATFSNLQKW
jgi:hypothetical protein